MADLTAAMGIGAPSLYAAFGSKEALYAEAIRYYSEKYSERVWSGFEKAATAREAVEAYLMGSATALTASGNPDEPCGCMVALSAVGDEGNADLGDLVRTRRAEALRQLEERFSRAVATGELPDSTDIKGLARFILAVQGGMALQARDGAGRAGLEAIARHTMAGWGAGISARISG